MEREKRIRQAGKNQRREEILKAAGKVFALKGYNGASTAEIAKEAGVAEGTIFRYFPTKKDILLNLATNLAVDTLQGLFAGTAGQKDEQVLKALLLNRLQLIRPNLYLAKFLFYEAQFHPEVRQVMFGEVLFKAVGMVSDYYRERVVAGVYKDIDPVAAVRGLIGAIFAYLMFESAMQELEPGFLDKESQEARDERNIDLIVDIFLNGVRKKQGEE
ncbi:MAG TPA: TetR/AcrR family transcriptional regulator [Candidatus Deferrimicrobium sp.]|nr:TetR/AcrR family transcriptional regulator [Candidatus Deferrimicrobium sp.]